MTETEIANMADSILARIDDDVTDLSLDDYDAVLDRLAAGIQREKDALTASRRRAESIDRLHPTRKDPSWQ